MGDAADDRRCPWLVRRREAIRGQTCRARGRSRAAWRPTRLWLGVQPSARRDRAPSTEPLPGDLPTQDQGVEGACSRRTPRVERPPCAALMSRGVGGVPGSHAEMPGLRLAVCSPIVFERVRTQPRRTPRRAHARTTAFASQRPLQPNGSVSNWTRVRGPRRSHAALSFGKCRFWERATHQRARRVLSGMSLTGMKVSGCSRAQLMTTETGARSCLRLRGHSASCGRTHEGRAMNTTTVTTPNSRSVAHSRAAHALLLSGPTPEPSERRARHGRRGWTSDGHAASAAAHGECPEVDAPGLARADVHEPPTWPSSSRIWGERTRLTQTMTFATTEERDMLILYAFEEAWKSGFERVDAVLQTHNLPLADSHELHLCAGCAREQPQGRQRRAP